MSAVAATPFSFKDFLKSFMLWELAKGMALTGRYTFRRKITVQFPEEKTPSVATLPWPARPAPL